MTVSIKMFFLMLSRVQDFTGGGATTHREYVDQQAARRREE